MRTVLGLAIVTIALLLPGSPARAAGPGFCSVYAKSLASESQGLKAKGGCGLATSDSFWSSDKSTQQRWCLGNSEDLVKRRLQEMISINLKCDYCKAYAGTMTLKANYNIQNKCGFSYSGDERWKPDNQFHFNGCMKFTHGGSGELYFTRDDLNSILGDVTEKIAECQSRSTNQAPLVVETPREPRLRDALEKLPRRPKLKDSIADTPCKPGARTMLSPCNVPTSGVIAPGMLESDQGSARQGPSATGAPSGGSGTSGGSPTYSRGGVR